MLCWWGVILVVVLVKAEVEPTCTFVLEGQHRKVFTCATFSINYECKKPDKLEISAEESGVTKPSTSWKWLENATHPSVNIEFSVLNTQPVHVIILRHNETICMYLNVGDHVPRNGKVRVSIASVQLTAGETYRLQFLGSNGRKQQELRLELPRRVKDMVVTEKHRPRKKQKCRHHGDQMLRMKRNLGTLVVYPPSEVRHCHVKLYRIEYTQQHCKGSCPVMRYDNWYRNQYVSSSHAQFDDLTAGCYCVGINSKRSCPPEITTVFWIEGTGSESQWVLWVQPYPALKEISMMLTWPTRCNNPVHVTLNSGAFPCDIKCDNSVNNCTGLFHQKIQLRPDTNGTYTFNELQPGNYCIRVRPRECNNPYEPCCEHVYSKTVELLSLSHVDDHDDEDGMSSLVYVFVVIFLVVVILCGVGYGCSMFREWYINREGGELPHSHSFDPLCQPKIVLLYTRDSPQLCETAKLFREMLKAANCKVLDHFEDTHSDTVSCDPHSWFHRHITNDYQTKVVLITSAGMVSVEDIVMRDRDQKEVQLTQQSGLDNMVILAVKMVAQLHKQAERVIVVSFDGITPTAESLTYFSHNRCLVLPKRIADLIKHIYRAPDEFVRGLMSSGDFKEAYKLFLHNIMVEKNEQLSQEAQEGRIYLSRISTV